MSARGTRILSRLFQATVRMKPDKKSSDGVEGATPVVLEKDLAFEPDFSSSEHERVWDYHTRLVFKDGRFVDMDLADEKRRLLCAGRLIRQSDSAFERRGQVELFVLLFDNYLVMTKAVGKRPGTTFHVNKRPIPLDLLKLEAHGDGASTRARRRSSLFLGRDDAAHLSESGALSPTSDHRGMFPFTVTHQGHFGASYTLYADTEETRSMWKSKLEEAIQLRKQSSRVFKMKVLNRESFLMKAGASSGYLPESAQLTRTINCVAPFTTRDGRSLMAIGCVEGLWVGNIRDPQSLHRILPLHMIRQCAVLEEFGIFLILTHNDLCAYDLESCVPTSAESQTYLPPQKLNRGGGVPFFRVGMVDGKVHVIFPRRQRTDTVFQIFEVVRSMEETPLETRPQWFRPYREFCLPLDCTDIMFLHRVLAIIHRDGFDILNPSDMGCFAVPLPRERNTEHKKIIKRCTAGQPLGVLRLEKETFLLCYDRFGVYIDRHGTLINGRVAVEWEGVAKEVSYHHPYVLLFSGSFVEVRHSASGKLEQIIRGHGMRCVWEGEGYRGEDPTVICPGQNYSAVGVTNAAAGLDELAVQCVFTLVPSNLSLSPIQTQPPLSTAERASARL